MTTDIFSDQINLKNKDSHVFIKYIFGSRTQQNSLWGWLALIGFRDPVLFCVSRSLWNLIEPDGPIVLQHGLYILPPNGDQDLLGNYNLSFSGAWIALMENTGLLSSQYRVVQKQWLPFPFNPSETFTSCQ